MHRRTRDTQRPIQVWSQLFFGLVVLWEKIYAILSQFDLVQQQEVSEGRSLRWTDWRSVRDGASGGQTGGQWGTEPQVDRLKVSEGRSVRWTHGRSVRDIASGGQTEGQWGTEPQVDTREVSEGHSLSWTDWRSVRDGASGGQTEGQWGTELQVDRQDAESNESGFCAGPGVSLDPAGGPHTPSNSPPPTGGLPSGPGEWLLTSGALLPCLLFLSRIMQILPNRFPLTLVGGWVLGLLGWMRINGHIQFIYFLHFLYQSFVNLSDLSSCRNLSSLPCASDDITLSPLLTSECLRAPCSSWAGGSMWHWSPPVPTTCSARGGTPSSWHGSCNMLLLRATSQWRTLLSGQTHTHTQSGQG